MQIPHSTFQSGLGKGFSRKTGHAFITLGRVEFGLLEETRDQMVAEEVPGALWSFSRICRTRERRRFAPAGDAIRLNLNQDCVLHGNLSVGEPKRLPERQLHPVQSNRGNVHPIHHFLPFSFLKLRRSAPPYFSRRECVSKFLQVAAS